MGNLRPPSTTPLPVGTARTNMSSNSRMARESVHLTRNGKTSRCSTRPGRTSHASIKPRQFSERPGSVAILQPLVLAWDLPARPRLAQ